MELNETSELMSSEDYKERFRAEWLQVKIRINSLEKMLMGYKNNTLKFTPSCSYQLLNSQLSAMKTYAWLLEERARVEHISL